MDLSIVAPARYTHDTWAFLSRGACLRISAAFSTPKDASRFWCTTAASMPCSSHMQKTNDVKVFCVWAN